MSIFPFIDPEALAASQDNTLPMFREYAYDYENNRLLLRDGQTYLVEGNEALRIWIFKALDTERFRYTAYDSDYGSEIDTLIGAVNSSVILPELKRFIIEALMVNPYIEELSNFQFEQSGSGVRVEFDCTTVYGKERAASDAGTFSITMPKHPMSSRRWASAMSFSASASSLALTL